MHFHVIILYNNEQILMSITNIDGRVKAWRILFYNYKIEF